jgi:hypothetical protein
MIILQIVEPIINLLVLSMGIFLIMCSIIGFIYIYDTIQRRISKQ